MNDLIRILTEIGPALSSDISARLRDEGRSDSAARQCVSRLPQDVFSLRRFTFPKKVRYLYLKQQFNTIEYWENLLLAINSASPAYASAISGIKSRGGIVPRQHFNIVSGSPVLQKKQLSGDTVLSRLLHVGIIEKVNIDGIGECLKLNEICFKDYIDINGLRPRLLTEKIVIDAVKKWSIHMNFASKNAISVRDETPSPGFVTFEFDMTSPCFLRPLLKFDGSKMLHGFFVADIIVGCELNDEMIIPFLRKCKMLSAIKNARPYIPMLIADGFTESALMQSRSNGIIATTPDSLFGNDIGRAIKDLYRTLANAASVATADFSKVEGLFSKLSSIEGAAGNLRGALFELIVGHIVAALECSSIAIGQVVTDTQTGKRAEIDVLCKRGRTVTIYECKGYQQNSEISEGEIHEWITKKIPTINNALRQQTIYSKCDILFQFWTCGRFSKEAIDILSECKVKIKKYGINWKIGSEIRDISTKLETSAVTKILDEHYFKHPIARATNMLFDEYPQGREEKN